MARHSLGSIVALSSDIPKCVFVTVIPVAPIAAFTWSGLSSNPGSAVSARGGVVVVVAADLVVDVLVPWWLPLLHPAVRVQMPATAGGAVRGRMGSPPPIPAVTPTVQRGAIARQRCRSELACDEPTATRGE